MTKASIETLLSLESFSAVLGINPWYFSQATTSAYGGSAACDSLWRQYAWMEADKVSREDVARAIAQAESDIAQQLGYWPAPKWITDEDQPYPRLHGRDLFGIYGINQRGQGKSVKATWGKVRSVGQRATTIISAGAAIAIVGDNVTITAATSVTEPAEIEVYFRVVDGADAAASIAFRIRPIKVVISAGTATITAKKWQFLDPDLWETDADLNGDTATNYVAAVDVYRVYNDPSDPADLYWETIPEGCTDTDGSGCSFGTQTACLLIRNAELGFLVPNPAEWDAVEEAFSEQSLAESWEPDKVRINYRAGYPLGIDGEMDDYWARAVAYYAVALLGREDCNCGTSGKAIAHWQEDLAINLSDRSYQNAQHVLDNRFGTERGAVFAWQRVRGRQLGRACAI